MDTMAHATARAHQSRDCRASRACIAILVTFRSSDCPDSDR